MIFGADTLGGARFPKIVLANVPVDWFVGLFLNTFGNAWPLLEKLGQRGQFGVRIHAVWDDAHKYRPRTHDPIIEREWERAKNYARNYRKTQVLFSPFCENNFTTKENRKVFGALLDDEEAKHMDNLVLVNSIWKGVEHPRILTERHGSKSAANGTDVYSYDGESEFDADVRKCYQKFGSSNIFFHWIPQFNLKSKVDDKTPREQRKAKPKAKHFETLKEYVRRDRREHDIPKGWIWKPVSEKDVICVIAPEKFDFIAIFLKDGKYTLRIDKCEFRSAFEGGGYRYYSRLWAIDICNRFPDAQLFACGVTSGKCSNEFPVDPIHRGGSYR